MSGPHGFRISIQLVHRREARKNTLFITVIMLNAFFIVILNGIAGYHAEMPFTHMIQIDHPKVFVISFLYIAQSVFQTRQPIFSDL